MGNVTIISFLLFFSKFSFMIVYESLNFILNNKNVWGMNTSIAWRKPAKLYSPQLRVGCLFVCLFACLLVFFFFILFFFCYVYSGCIRISETQVLREWGAITSALSLGRRSLHITVIQNDHTPISFTAVVHSSKQVG